MASTNLRRWSLAATGFVMLALWLADRQWLWPPAARRAVAAAPASVVRPVQSIVTARGRLQPAGGVIRVAGPSRPGAVVATLAVQEGDWVSAGAVLAVLDGTAAQRALVQRLQAEAKNAATEARRYERLYRDGIVSAAERDRARMDVDVARADLARAQAELDACSVHAPITGRVLTVHAHPGERIGPDGILDLGNTAEMEVLAEVYETDIAAVRLGQPASVSAAALPEPLEGTVARIGLRVGKLSVFEIDPAADTDARVVEVHIRLDNDTHVASLTNLQVDVDLAL
jgi:RND family efflux transporter MFP subunit